ncbi:hypothetical protein HJFPF1_13572 [Paramyrothecium foliicola]|nr:hypothetical protein HJFPF1_13572 [Paramyrothecium foliicola]
MSRPVFNNDCQASNKWRDIKYLHDGYASISTNRSYDFVLGRPKGLHHGNYQFQSPADLHGDSLKEKPNPIRKANQPSLPSFPSSSIDELMPYDNPESRLLNMSMPVRLPIRRCPIIESEGCYASDLIYSAVSPSINDDFCHEHPPCNDGRKDSEHALSTQKSCDQSRNLGIDNNTSLKRLHSDDAYAIEGLKRRASSSADDQIKCGITGSGNFVHHQGVESSVSPIPVPTKIQGESSTSLICSVLHSKLGMSSTFTEPSRTVTTTMKSFECRSPVSSSFPGGISSASCSSPYATPTSLRLSPQASIYDRSTAPLGREIKTILVKTNETQMLYSRPQYFYLCNCCPKNPQKFDTAEQLRYFILLWPFSKISPFIPPSSWAQQGLPSIVSTKP